MNTESDTRAPDLSACLAIGVGAVLSVVFMAYHPVGGGADMQAVVASMVEQAPLNRTVHGVLVCLMGVVVYGLVDFARVLGWRHGGVRAGMVAYVAGMLWLTGAALVSGLVVPGVAEAYADAPAAELEGLRPIFRFSWELNQALANAGTVAWGLAILLLSWPLKDRGGLARATGWFGLLVGTAAGLGIVSGHLDLHVHGMLLVVVGTTVWCVGVASWMFQLRRGARSA